MSGEPQVGLVEWVEEKPARAFTAADAAEGDTVLTLNSVAVFSDATQVSIDGLTYEVDVIDTEALTLTLVDGLFSDIESGFPVDVYPEKAARYAAVRIDDNTAADSADLVSALVPHVARIFQALDVGIRDDFAEREQVKIGGWPDVVVLDVLNDPPMINGAAIDGATTVPPEALTDGIAPDQAPTEVSTIGGLNQIFVRWVAITNETPVDYEVHVSDTASFTPSDATLLTTTAGTLVAAKMLADGTAFEYDTDYYFQVRAVDADGEGPASDEVSDRMNQTASPDIAVGAVTAEKLEAILVLATQIVTATAGQRIEIDVDGIRSYDSDDNLLVEWSAATGLMTWRSAGVGPRVQLDDDGLTTFTDEPVLLWVTPGVFTRVATDGTNLYAIETSVVHKYDPATGVENTSGFPIVGMFTFVDSDGTYIYAIDASQDIYKYNATTGASVGGGFPVAGTFANLVTDGTHLYVTDSGNDIRKYANSNGVENTSGFPIVGNFLRHDVGGGFIYAIDSATLDIYKYNATTGASVGGGFPITGSFDQVAADGTHLYAIDTSGDVHKYDPATGVEDTGGSWPVAGSYVRLSTDGTRLIITDNANDMRAWNADDAFQSVRIDSATGLLDFVGPVSGPTGDFDILVTKSATIPALTGPTTLTGDLAVSGDVTVGDDLTVTDALTVNGNVALGNATSDTVTVAGDLSVGDDLVVTDAFTLGSEPVTGAWTAFTPTLTSTSSPTNFTIAGKYMKIGRTVHWSVTVTFTGTPAGSGGWILGALPFTRSGRAWASGSATLGSTISPVWGYATGNGTTVSLRTLGTNPDTSAVSVTVPHAWANGDVLFIHGTYEATT